ncbi:MAG: hypothetical protein RLZZ326_3806, partial [Planctomycetota bacterium]
MRYAGGPVVVRGRGIMAAVVCLGCLVAAGGSLRADEEGFEPLFDGKSLAGWKVNENPQSWKVDDGQIVCRGPRSHLFYVGADAAK